MNSETFKELCISNAEKILTCEDLLSEDYSSGVKSGEVNLQRAELYLKNLVKSGHFDNKFEDEPSGMLAGEFRNSKVNSD